MRGAVAAGHERTAAAAAELLRTGGNAVDAAVAGALAAFVAEPLLASPGGAGVLVAALPGRAPVTIEFFADVPGRGGVAPPALDFVGVDVDFGSAVQTFHVGRGSASPPSALPGLARAAELCGTCPLDALVAPAARLARDGVCLGPGGAHVYALLWSILERDPETLACLAPAGRPDARTVVRFPALADTLEAFAREGGLPEVLRAGCLEAFGPARGGFVTEHDLLDYLPAVVAPLSITLGPLTAHVAPTAGGRLVELILRALGDEPPGAAEIEELAHLARASGAAYAARDALLCDELGAGNTTHLSVLDGRGGAAAVTLTNGEGCGHVVPGTGVQLNNFLGEDDLHPRGFHASHPPGSRLPTMVAPTVALRDGVPVLALGSGGANRIRSAVAQVLYRLAARGEPPAQAVLAPRIHAEGPSLWLELEGLREPDAALEAMRGSFSAVFPFPARNFFFGGVHTVALDARGEIVAVPDPRRHGAGARG